MGILDTITTHHREQKALEKGTASRQSEQANHGGTPGGNGGEHGGGHSGVHGGPRGAGAALSVPLVSRAGKRDLWLSFACSWLVTAGMCTSFIASGSLLDQYLFNISEGARPGAAPLFAALETSTIVVIALAGALGALVFSVAKAVLSARSQLREENQVRLRILRKVFALGPARMQKHPTGKIVSLASESAEKLMLFRQGFLADVLASFTAPALVLVFMAVFLSPWTALVLALFVPVIPAVVVAFEKLFSKTSNASRAARARLSAQYLDAIGGLATLQLLGASERIAHQLAGAGEDNRLSIMRLLRGNQLVLLVIDAAFSLAMVTVCTAMTLTQLANGSISGGQALACLALAMLLLEPIDQVGAFFYVGMGGMAAGRAIGGFLAAPEGEVTNTATTPPVQKTVKTRAQENAPTTAPSATEKTAIVAENLGFSYGHNQVITDLNLSVSPGARVALVGPSGVGKSTLLNLLKGFLPPATGRLQVGSAVCCGEQDTGGADAKALRAASAMVAQSTWLFTGTIRENLTLACPQSAAGNNEITDKQITDEQIWSALRAAHLETDVAALPQGLDTPLGEGGAGLSTGQAQRLSLARALLSGRGILLLDEPTSAVDLDSERQILAAINDIAGRTIFMSTHRRSALATMDRVVNMCDGQLSEGSAL